MALVEYYGTGRRKTSTARVHIRPGSGAITVNRRTLDNYFGNEVLKMIIKQPLSLTETVDKFDIVVTVGEDGLAREVQMAHSSGHRLLDVAVRNWAMGQMYAPMECDPADRYLIRLALKVE